MQIAGEFSSVLVNIGIPAILGLQVWIVKKVQGHDIKFTRLETVLLGPNGDNGLNGRINKVEETLKAPPIRAERRKSKR